MGTARNASPPQGGLVQDRQVQPRVPGPQHRPGAGPQPGQGGPRPGLSPAQPRRQPRQPQGGGVQGSGGGGQIHGQPRRHARHRPGGNAPLPAAGQGGGRRQQPAQGDAPVEGQGGQSDETAAQQGQQPRPPGGGGAVRPPARRGQGRAKEPGASRGQQDLQGEMDDLRRRPPRPGLGDEAGEGAQGAGHGGHGPGGADGPPVIEGEAHREGEEGGGGVPQGGGEAQGGQGAEAGPRQGGRPWEPRARGGHQGQAEGGPVPKDHRPGQHRRQQQVDGRPEGQLQGPGGQADLSGPPGLLPQLVQCGVNGVSGCHAALLLSGPGRPAWLDPHYIPIIGKYPSKSGGGPRGICRGRAKLRACILGGNRIE